MIFKCIHISKLNLFIEFSVPPRAFSFVSNGTTYSGNRTIISPGTNVALILTFKADFLPTVKWMFTNLNNVTMELDLENNDQFNTSNLVLINMTNNIYQVMD